MAHRPFALVASALLVAALVGCSGDDQESSGEPLPTYDPSGDAANASPALPTQAADSAGNRFGDEQAAAVLPVVADLPEGWAEDPQAVGLFNVDGVVPNVTDPAECAMVVDLIDAEQMAGKDAASAQSAFRVGEQGPFVGVAIRSYDQPVPAELLPRARDGLTRCGTITPLETAGSANPSAATEIQVGNVGDETIAMRLTGTAEENPFTVDAIVVKVGNNLIGAYGLGLSTAPPELPVLEGLVATTLTKLDGVE